MPEAVFWAAAYEMVILPTHPAMQRGSLRESEIEFLSPKQSFSLRQLVFPV